MDKDKSCVLCNVHGATSSQVLAKFYFHKFVFIEDDLRHLPIDIIQGVCVLYHMDKDAERQITRYVWFAYLFSIHNTLHSDAVHVANVFKLWETEPPQNEVDIVSPKECGHAMDECRTMLAKGDSVTVFMGAFPFTKTYREKEAMLTSLIVRFLNMMQIKKDDS